MTNFRTRGAAFKILKCANTLLQQLLRYGQRHTSLSHRFPGWRPFGPRPGDPLQSLARFPVPQLTITRAIMRRTRTSSQTDFRTTSLVNNRVKKPWKCVFITKRGSLARSIEHHAHEGLLCTIAGQLHTGHRRPAWERNNPREPWPEPSRGPLPHSSRERTEPGGEPV